MVHMYIRIPIDASISTYSKQLTNQVKDSIDPDLTIDNKLNSIMLNTLLSFIINDFIIIMDFFKK